MAMRDILRLLEALAKAGKDVSPDVVRAILARTGAGKARASEVMTSVGPDNARVYSAILSGKESMDVGNAAVSNGLATLLRSSPAPQSASQPVIPLEGPDASRPVIPLDDAKQQSKLRTAVKRLSTRTTPGSSRPVIPIREDEPMDLPGPSVAQDVKGLTMAERYQRLKGAGKLLSSAEVAARTLKRKPSQRDIVTESERQEQRDRDRDAAELARSKPVVPFTPEAPPVLSQPQQQAQKVEQSKLLEALKRLTEVVKESNRPRTTVAQEVAGLSWGQRWSRLQASSSLLSEEVVKAATLKDRVSKRDVILESERREQQKRDRDNAVLPSGGRLGSFLHLGQTLLRGGAGRGGGGAGVAAGAAGAGGSGGMGAAVARLVAMGSNPYVLLAGAAVAAGVALFKLPGATERLAASLMESRRHLRLYDGALAATFARLDVQQRLLDIRTAQATSGSGALLGSSLESLRNETQWAREAKETAKNVGGTVGVTLGRAANAVIRYAPSVQQGLWTLKAIEKLLAWFEPSTKDNPALNEHLLAIASGEWAKPKNRKPAIRRPDRNREE